MTRIPPAAVLLVTWLAVAAPAVARAPEPATRASPDPRALPSPAAPAGELIQMTGYEEGRFNPNRGTVFFILGGERALGGAANVAVTVNGEPLPPGRVRIGGRVVAASLSLAPGLNRLGMTAWDAQGEIGSTERRVWVGDGGLAVDLRDAAGEPVNDATVTVSLASNPSVSARTATTAGRAAFFNLPREVLGVAARGPDGRTATARVPPGERRVELRLR